MWRLKRVLFPACDVQGPKALSNSQDSKENVISTGRQTKIKWQSSKQKCKTKMEPSFGSVLMNLDNISRTQNQANQKDDKKANDKNKKKRAKTCQKPLSTDSLGCLGTIQPQPPRRTKQLNRDVRQADSVLERLGDTATHPDKKNFNNNGDDQECLKKNDSKAPGNKLVTTKSNASKSSVMAKDTLNIGLGAFVGLGQQQQQYKKRRSKRSRSEVNTDMVEHIDDKESETVPPESDKSIASKVGDSTVCSADVTRDSNANPQESLSADETSQKSSPRKNKRQKVSSDEISKKVTNRKNKKQTAGRNQIKKVNEKRDCKLSSSNDSEDFYTPDSCFFFSPENPSDNSRQTKESPIPKKSNKQAIIVSCNEPQPKEQALAERSKRALTRRAKQSKETNSNKIMNNVKKNSKPIRNGSGTPRTSNCSASKDMKITSIRGEDYDKNACKIRPRPNNLPFTTKLTEKYPAPAFSGTISTNLGSVVRCSNDWECWDDFSLPDRKSTNEDLRTGLPKGSKPKRSIGGNGSHVYDVEFSVSCIFGEDSSNSLCASTMKCNKTRLRKRRSTGQSGPVRRSRRRSVEPDRFVGNFGSSDAGDENNSALELANSNLETTKATSNDSLSITSRRSRRKSSPPKRLIDEFPNNADNHGGNEESKPQKRKRQKSLDVSFSLKDGEDSKSVKQAKSLEDASSRDSKRSRRQKGSEKLQAKKDNPEKESVELQKEKICGPGEWGEEEVARLRNAHKKVNPRSTSFWYDIAEIVESRTSSECREKWFSLVKTPLPPKSKRKASAPSQTHDIALSTHEDDIFNSTPMRGVFDLDDCGLGLHSSIGNLDFLSIGSAIKVAQSSEVGNTHSNVPKKPGNKTYIKGMRREINKETRQQAKSRKKKVESFDPTKKLSEKAIEGAVEMKCQLSPGGTLNVKTVAGGSDDEDEGYFIYDDEGDE